MLDFDGPISCLCDDSCFAHKGPRQGLQLLVRRYRDGGSAEVDGFLELRVVLVDSFFDDPLVPVSPRVSLVLLLLLEGEDLGVNMNPSVGPVYRHAR